MIKFEYLIEKTDQYMGLRHRASLDANTALVFVDIAPHTTFVSEDCLIPFSIIALDKDDRVIKVARMYPPHDVFVTPDGTCNVIEGSGDFCDVHKVRLGEKFPYDWRKGINERRDGACM